MIGVREVMGLIPVGESDFSGVPRRSCHVDQFPCHMDLTMLPVLNTNAQ